MRPEQWETFKRAAKGQAGERVPLAMIVDSPWMPGFLGLNTIDYLFDPDVWFKANIEVMERYREIIFVPSWWVEYGMAIEPSALGAKVRFWQDHCPDIVPRFKTLAECEGLEQANPATDGLMPVALRQYATRARRVRDAGYTIPMATARGPLCLAAFLRGITEFMVDLTEDPDAVHRFLEVATETVIRWLKAQCEAIGTVEGVFVLDDVPGLLSKRSYLEFAHPYLKRVFDAFPADWVKVYHNDANVKPFASELPGLGIDVLNWSHKYPLADLVQATGGRIVPMGNVAPLDLGVNGTPEQVRAAALDVIAAAKGGPLILSVGGGTSPGMPAGNIQALLDAVT